uniref:Uncharacterized protein n=1 Tax=Ditylenchus dipsaci TaxID=166011 RepID=A0A915E0F5_9BILA
MPNPPPQEDTWAFQLYGTPFPEMPVKCFGQQNQYVALWYKHGKPIHGRAWNNNGVVEASFPYSKAELTGTRDLKGEIQVLQYKGDHLSLGYWYNWIKYKERKVKPDSERQLVKCGESMPILWASRPEGALLGYLDLATEAALFSHDKTTTKVTGNALDDMLIIVRELKGGPQTCECIECVPPVAPAAPPPPPPPPANLIMTHNWPTSELVIRFLLLKLFVLLVSGEPVMGRIWNDKGKIAACFSWGGHEYRNSIGSIQVLLDLPERVRDMTMIGALSKKLLTFLRTRNGIRCTSIITREISRLVF